MGTKLGTKFVTEAIENKEFEYCNRSKAEKCAEIAVHFAINFSIFARNLPNASNYSSLKLMELYQENLENNKQ